MKKALLVTLMLMTCGKALAIEDAPLEAFAKTIAHAVFSNDLAAVTNSFLPPNQGWRDETLKSWQKTRETGDARGIQWNLCIVTALRIQKLTTHGKLRVADVFLDCTDGMRTFTLFLDECQERDGKWLLFCVKWREPKPDEGTTTPRTVPSPAPGAGEVR